MTVIMSETSGGRTRRCDSRCHTARGPKCRCICGGRYHGCGSSEIAERMVEEALAGMYPSMSGRAPWNLRLPLAEKGEAKQ